MSTRKPNGYWTKELILIEAKKYKTNKEWAASKCNSYSSAYRLKVMDEACKHMVRLIKPNGYWSKERCAEIATKFKTRKEWELCGDSSYGRARVNGWLDDCCKHMSRSSKPSGYWDIKENVLASAQQYKTKVEWDNAETSAFQAAHKHGWLDDVCSHMIEIRKSNNYWTKERVLEDALKYTRLVDWRNANSTAVKRSQLDGYFSKATSHMICYLNLTVEEQKFARFARDSLKRTNKSKEFDGVTHYSRLTELFGYSGCEFYTHIENHFQEGMSWSNYPEWQIDHIKPVSAFIDEGIIDPSIINALSNLQPIWAEDNRSKRNKYDPEIHTPTEVHKNVYDLIK